MVGSVPNADVYQMLAYLTALQQPNGLLVYAAGEDLPHTITVPFADKRVPVQTIDVTQAPHDVLRQIANLTGLIRSIAGAPAVTPAATS
jgi:5-methylcytosine-specific restriction enzyme subunit McrC